MSIVIPKTFDPNIRSFIDSKNLQCSVYKRSKVKGQRWSVGNNNSGGAAAERVPPAKCTGSEGRAHGQNQTRFTLIYLPAL